MKTRLLCTFTCLLLVTSTSLSQANDLQYFSALVTAKDGSDRRLIDLNVTPSMHEGRLVIMGLTKRWSTSNIVVYQYGRDFTIEHQGQTGFLIRIEMTSGMASSMMITYVYDECLVDLKMTETIITAGNATFSEWSIWKREGSQFDQGLVSFLFPYGGIYPYFDKKARELMKQTDEELKKQK